MSTRISTAVFTAASHTRRRLFSYIFANVMINIHTRNNGIP